MQTSKFQTLLTTCTAALIVAVPGAVHAQEPGTISITTEAGIGIPTGSLADVSDLGPAFRFATDYGVSDGLALRGTVGAEVFEAITSVGGRGPTVRLVRLTVGPSIGLVRPDSEAGFRLGVHAGVGGTAFTAGRSLVGTGSAVRTIDFTEVYPALDAGVGAGYAFSESVSAHLSTGASLNFADEADTEVFTFLNPEVEPFSSLVSVPITAGVRVDFPR